MRHTGTVFNFNFERGYGQISIDGRSSAGNRIFFHARSVEPDLLGRRSIPPNSPVSFEIVWDGGRGREAAIDVRNLDPTLELVDPDKHEEFGQAKKWDGSVGYVVRPSKDTLRFTERSIISEGIATIRVGTWLHYSIGRHVEQDKPVGFFARNVSVCTDPEPVVEDSAPDDIESHFLEVEELPLSCPEIAPAPVVSVLAPPTRKMTLLEIIQRNRQ